MGKRTTPEQVQWQEAARRRVGIVLERKFDGHQARMASALGVSHTLVYLVVRSIQPPTRNLMSKIGTIDGVNPRWADTGDGEPFLPDLRGTLPLSSVLLPGPVSNHPDLMTGGRFTVPPAFDRPTCYYWPLPPHHPATEVGGWRVREGDLMLLETSTAMISKPDAIIGKMCVLDGQCLGRSEPLYGEVIMDEKRRIVFRDDEPRLRGDYLPPSSEELPLPRKNPAPGRRRTIINLDRAAKKAADRAADPWYSLPAFTTPDVLAVQLMMVRL